MARLEQVFTIDGASRDTTPVFHYVVEMDPESGWMPELSQWYDTEHMPGLAKVPGCIRASRFLNHDHGPLSLACYDLVTEDTLGSAPWLAVRGSPWSDRMRPRFTNTKRTMFRTWTLTQAGPVLINGRQFSPESSGRSAESGSAPVRTDPHHQSTE